MKERRVQRISSGIKKIISEALISDIKDPRINNTKTSVTDVETTNDLSFSYIYISVFGNEAEKAETLKGFEKAKGFLRKKISSNLDLRHTPTLIFKLDESIEKGINMGKLINKVVENDKLKQEQYND